MKLFRPTFIALALCAGLLVALNSARAGTVSRSDTNARTFEQSTLEASDFNVTRHEIEPLVFYEFTFTDDGAVYLPGTLAGVPVEKAALYCDGTDGGGTMTPTTTLHRGASPTWLSIEDGQTTVTCTAACFVQLTDGSAGPFTKFKIALASSTSPTLACVAVFEKE